MYRNIKVTTQGKGNHYKMKKWKTGQEAFIINESNNEITPVIVDKAGRIYLTVGRQRFSLDHGLGRLPWSHDYGVANYLAPDKETAENYLKRRELTAEIRKAISRIDDMDLKTLQAIADAARNQ